MSFFDPNDNSKFDPSTFNVNAAQQQLQFRQSLAKNMMQLKPPEGQMVGGWYSAPNWKSHLATALTNMLGAYGMDKATGDGQKQLDANSVEALKYQMNNQPQATTGQSYDASNQIPMGPPQPDNGVQMGAVSNPIGQSSSFPIDQLSPGFGPSTSSTPSNPSPLSQSIKARGQLQDKVLAPGTFEPIQDDSLYGTSGTPVQTTTPPSLGDNLAWAAKLSQTGTLGAGIAQNMIAKQYPNYDVQLDKDNGKVIMVDKNNPANIKVMSYTDGGLKPNQRLKNVEAMYKGVRTPEQLEAVNEQLRKSGVPASQLTSDINVARGIGGQNEAMNTERGAAVGYDQAKAAIKTSMDRLNSVLHPEAGQPSINDGTGLTGGIASKLPWATNSTAIRSRAADAASGIVLATLQAMKSSGVGTGAFNSDAEGKRLENFSGSIDWTRMSTTEVTNKLTQLHEMANGMIDRLDTARSTTVPQSTVPNQTAPQVPARGKSVSASQYGF